jgi:hypothetical protein
MGRLQARLQDAWMLSLAPRLPSGLPWKAAYACYRAIARSPALFAEAVDAAATIAPAHVPIADIEAFRHDARTLWLLETADLYLSRQHAVDWLPAHVAVEGAWPSGPFVALTFHYGTGIWLCRALRRAGHPSMFLSARFERDEFAGRPWRFDYGMRRLDEVQRVCGEPIAYRPGVRETLLDALRRGSSIIGLIDMPPRLAQRGQVGVRLLDRSVSFPDGLLRLAAQAGVPVVPCWVDIDFATGHRTVVIGGAKPPDDPVSVLAGLADDLDRLIKRRPAAWMFWPEWEGWLRDASDARAAATFSNPDVTGTLGTSGK